MGLSTGRSEWKATGWTWHRTVLHRAPRDAHSWLRGFSTVEDVSPGCDPSPGEDMFWTLGELGLVAFGESRRL
ncbi:hypothetical protein CORC01_09152 [Colletotrichum orchidophilum]|uniref:Uncharacterized protein n=1 Tax=Colletotrichum orchidophilum TaxID=1209926 RepID=A0A1G4B2N2_9PEZI|nr:uncharacterized protein CORC01_09152 [Colletotrichum orchidophilum]OHE95562.1 hypothetical protein CORC01_09152 [Colletotrichum orchidophilum]